jgi:lysozyme family protein
MSLLTNKDIIDRVLEREGGDKFTMDPADRGGATKFGITQRTLSDYLGRGVSVVEVKELTREVAESIYEKLYIEKPGFNKISNLFLREVVVDCGVNHGQSIATRWLQKAVNVDQDGILGPLTRQAIDGVDLRTVIAKICSYRIKFYVRLVIKDMSQIKFLAGWITRATYFLEKLS